MTSLPSRIQIRATFLALASLLTTGCTSYGGPPATGDAATLDSATLDSGPTDLGVEDAESDATTDGGCLLSCRENEVCEVVGGVDTCVDVTPADGGTRDGGPDAAAPACSPTVFCGTNNPVINTCTDPAHCGGCDDDCTGVPNTNASLAACTGGSCVIECEGGFYNCDDNPGNGCEQDEACD